MSADQRSSRDGVPTGPPGPKATGQAARKIKAKAAKSQWVPNCRKNADGPIVMGGPHGNTIITELGPAVKFLYAPGCESIDEIKGLQRAGSSTDDMPPLEGDSPRGCVEEKRIYPGDKEEVAYPFDGFVAFAGSEKMGLQMWNESPSTAPGKGQPCTRGVC